MIVLLPPILFSSTLRINKKIFFKNFFSILFFAFLGTFLAIITNTFFLWIFSNFFQISFKIDFFYCLIFSTIISATDPVSVLATLKKNKIDKNLFSLIFGESILNDAISLAFYNGIINFGENQKKSNFQIFGFSILNFFVIILVSIILGIFLGFLACLVLKKISARTKKNQEKILQHKDFIKFYKKIEIDRLQKEKFVIKEKKTKGTTYEILEESNNSSDNLNKSKGTTYDSSEENIILNKSNDNFEKSKGTTFKFSSDFKKIIKLQKKKISELSEKFDKSLNQEIALMCIVPLLSYLISESLNFSGIISILFNGLFLSRYSLFNLNKKSFLILNKVITALSDIFESVAFLIIGLSLFTFHFPEISKNEKITFFFFFVNFCFLLISRFINIFVVSAILNFFKKKKKICFKKKILMVFSGLRGAMAFALAIVNIDNKFGEVFFLLILYLSLASTFVFGGIMPFLINILKIENFEEEIEDDDEEGTIFMITKNVERNLEKYFKSN